MIKLLILAVFFLSSGCGYTTRGSIYAGKKIMVRPVINTIDVTSLSERTSGYVNFPILIENKLTNEIVSKFNNDGQLKVVSQDQQALTLTCSVDSYTKQTLRYEEANDGEVKEQRLRLHTHIKLTSATGEVLIEEDVVGETEYLVSGSETTAQIALVSDTARRISEAVLEQW
ncbi:MAG: hypothetical protein K9L86_03585 [Candidatus Omnitrophica bacterium]|nr:hypothetical protein [Candidatus Omnitrophota bacterium]